MERSMGLYSTSSGAREFLSVEKGVLSSGNGRRWSRCLEIRLRRCVVDVGASFSDLRRGCRGVQFWLGGIGLLVNSRGKHTVKVRGSPPIGGGGEGWEGSDWLRRRYEEGEEES
jgi:hypothetical protein